MNWNPNANVFVPRSQPPQQTTPQQANPQQPNSQQSNSQSSPQQPSQQKSSPQQANSHSSPQTTNQQTKQSQKVQQNSQQKISEKNENKNGEKKGVTEKKEITEKKETKNQTIEKEVTKISSSETIPIEKVTNEVKVDNFSPSEEEIRKELERIALEEGKTIEELEKEEVAEEKLTSSTEISDQDDPREHLNIVFIGHVDAGKSTLSGQILFLSGMVDQRTIEKYEREAKEKNRESWFFAYIMDTNEEERSKGITVEVGRASFETKNKRYTILDAPGHKLYVPNMIGGASQADVGILVISARKGEFETGFTRGGQTREHAMLAKTLGVKNLIVVVNKMDEPTVAWAKERFDEIEASLSPYLKQLGYNLKKEVFFVPISAQKGYGIKDSIPKDVCPWYEGKTLLTILDELNPIDRLYDAPVRIPIVDRYREGGKTWALGKVESGTIVVGHTLALYPNKTLHEITDIATDTKALKKAKAGENIRLALKGLEEDKIQTGFVLCSPKSPVPCQNKFEAQVMIMELLPHKSLFTAGYTAVLHIHTTVEECTITALVAQLDKKTGEIKKKKPTFVKSGEAVRCIIQTAQPVCIELFTENPQLGRFTLRDEGKTIAIGKITSLGPKKKEEGLK